MWALHDHMPVDHSIPASHASHYFGHHVICPISYERGKLHLNHKMKCFVDGITVRFGLFGARHWTGMITAWSGMIVALFIPQFRH